MNATQRQTYEWVYQTSMPQHAKQAFTEAVATLTFNPYEVLAGTENGKRNTDIYTTVSNLLKEAWPACQQAVQLMLDAESPVEVMVIQNAPVDTDLKNIPTPNDGVRPTSKTFVTEYMMVALAGLMESYLRAPSSEKFPFNLPIHQVAPQAGFEFEEATNRGVGNFPFHNDRVFVESEKVDYHLLYGLRTGAHPTTTNFLRVYDLLEGTDHRALGPLFEKNYRDSKTGVCVAALHGTSSDLENVTASVDLHEGWMEPINAEAEQTLSLLKRQGASPDVTSKAVNILLEEGTIVLSNHKKLLHGRGSFKAGNVGERRWLQRAHLCKLG